MLRGFSILFLIILTSAPVLGSEITEIPLPELHGSYSEYFGTIRTASFQFDTLPTTIYNAWIKLSGEAHVGLYECYWGYCCVWLWCTEFIASMDDSLTGGDWKAINIIPRQQFAPHQDGSFELVIPFTPYSGATWEFLKSGGGKLVLLGRHEYMPASLSCVGWDHPSALVESAMLVIEADIKVAIESTSWGRIKSMFSN